MVHVDAHDRLLGAEVTYGSVIERVRFLTAANGWGSWTGRTLSTNTRTVRMMAANGGCDFVTGFYGTQSTLRVLSINLIGRKVQEESIFSYWWAEAETGPSDGMLLDGTDPPEEETVAFRHRSLTFEMIPRTPTASRAKTPKTPKTPGTPSTPNIINPADLPEVRFGLNSAEVEFCTLLRYVITYK